MSQVANQSYPVVKFPHVGAKVSGAIVAAPSDYQVRDFATKEPKHWKDGSPVMGTRITVDTPEGPQTIWAQGRILSAIKRGFKAANLPVGSDLEVGGWISVERVEDGKPEGGGQPPRNYESEYKPPANTPAAQDDGPPF